MASGGGRLIDQWNIQFHNVPVQLTPLIGREQEIQALCAILRQPERRLVTLIGPGGVGKTRLSLQAADHLLADFDDGVYFIPLASIRASDLVITAISRVLEIKETGEQALFARLEATLQDKQMLLVLDNFEQVLPAAPLLSTLLAACPRLTILVTSRAVLRIRGEYEFSVPSLQLPDLAHLPVSETLSHYASVALFQERAQAVKADFRVTPANARAIAEICVRLDGLPLALELAAARIKLLSPQALLGRLEHRLAILTGGGRDAPERQQTLRKTIEWSYDLLDAEEQRLFRCLCAFVGGCALEALESVYAALYGTLFSVFDGIASLLDKSLLSLREQNSEEPRVMIMETIREYGLEMLAASGEMERVLQEHTVYYLRLAENAESELAGSQQALWSERLAGDYDNLRTALQWLLAQIEESEVTSSIAMAPELALRLAATLSWFWWVRGYLTEGRNFLERALAISENVDASSLKAKVLFSTVHIAFVQGDYKQTVVLAESILVFCREIGDKRGIALALDPLGNVAWLQGNITAACAMKEESLTLYRELDDTGHIASSLFSLGLLESSRGEYARAQTLFEESLAIEKTSQNKRGVAHVLSQLAQLFFVILLDLETIRPLIEESLELSQEVGFKEGIAASHCLSAQLALSQGNLSAATVLAKQGVALYKEIGHRHGVAKSLAVLGKIVAVEGDYEAAHMLLVQCLEITNELGETWVAAVYLMELGEIVAAQGQLVWAAQLWGASEMLREVTGIPIPRNLLADYKRSVSSVCSDLGEKKFTAAWTQGRSLTPEQALAAKVQHHSTSQSPQVSSAQTFPKGLTTREVEVLRLLASGLTDLKIAETLILSPRTVHTHISSIYLKLSVTSRSAATRYAIEHHLA
jgi:predicted ATPase/DNA-binding CsgD family transcriptional regulator